MDVSLGALVSLARETVIDPRAGARRILAIDLQLTERWMALGLTVVMSTILTHLSFEMSPAEVREYFGSAFASPIRTALIQGVAMVLGALAMYHLGRARGGTGSLPEAISLLAWLQFILLLVQVAQLVAEVVLPPLASVLGLAGVAAFFWLMTNFVAELHGFRSLFSTFFGVLLSLAGLVMVLAMLLAPFFPTVAGV